MFGFHPSFSCMAFHWHHIVLPLVGMFQSSAFMSALFVDCFCSGKTPGSSIRTADRISALSPAAKRLVSSGRVLRSGDSSLRTSYSPHVSRTPGSPWVRSSSSTPRRSTSSSLGKSPQTGTSGLTDNLLQLS